MANPTAVQNPADFEPDESAYGLEAFNDQIVPSGRTTPPWEVPVWTLILLNPTMSPPCSFSFRLKPFI